MGGGGGGEEKGGGEEGRECIWFEVGNVPATLQVGQNMDLAERTHTTFKKHTWVG